MKKISTYFILLTALCIILCACDTPKEINHIIGISQEDTVTETPVKRTDSNSKTVSLGEDFLTISSSDIQGWVHGISYKVENPQLYDNIVDAGFTKNIPQYTEIYDMNGIPDYIEIEGLQILTCELTITNIEETNYKELLINKLNLVYVDPDTQVTHLINHMGYFEESQHDADAHDYFAYDLPIGKSLHTKVAWYFCKDDIDLSNLYLCCGANGEMPIYVALNLKDEML